MSMPYCNVLAIKETINIFLRNPLGIGNHQIIIIDAAKVNLKPIKRKGGKCSIAGLAITKPKPKKIGTSAATKCIFKTQDFTLFNKF